MEPLPPLGEVFQWTSKEIAGPDGVVHTGLNYTWRMPESFDRRTASDVLILFHPIGKDHRWGMDHFDPALMASDRIIICPDGPSALAQGVRAFRDDYNDYLFFSQFILEISQVFPANRIFLVGAGQGGSFAASFAAQFPGLAEGVVCLDSDVWPSSSLVPDEDGGQSGSLELVPLILLSTPTSAKDGAVPLSSGAALTTFEAALTAQHRATWLRCVDSARGSPPPLVAESLLIRQSLDFCGSMNAADPDEVLATARKLLEPLTWTSAGPSRAVVPMTFEPPAFSAAVMLLRRLTSKSDDDGAFAFLEEVPEARAAAATSLLARIDAHAARHIELIRADLKSGAELTPDGRPGIAHMALARELFRGTPSMEAFATESGYDATRAEQNSRRLIQAALAMKDEQARYEALVAAIPASALLGPFPPSLFTQLDQLKKDAAAREADSESEKDDARVEATRRSWDAGAKQFRRTWQEWTSSDK